MNTLELQILSLGSVTVLLGLLATYAFRKSQWEKPER